MSGERLLVKYVLDLRTQTIKAATQIGHTGCDPDLRPHWKIDHLRRLSRIDCTRQASAPCSTLIRARPASSMLIAPAVDGLDACSLMSSLPSDTVTGTSAAQDSRSSPRSMSRRHLNTWFAFTL